MPACVDGVEAMELGARARAPVGNSGKPPPHHLRERHASHFIHEDCRDTIIRASEGVLETMGTSASFAAILFECPGS